jgi:Rrf2 family protein
LSLFNGKILNLTNPSGEPGYTGGALHPSAVVELSCKSEYALLALLELAASYSGGEPLQIRQIAAEQNIPDRYLEQLLATLRRAGIIRSQRGAKGGYILAREPWKIALLEVINCIEGTDSQSAEAHRVPKSVEGAVIREVWQEAGNASDAVLQKYTLQDIADKREARQRLDLMYYI